MFTFYSEEVFTLYQTALICFLVAVIIGMISYWVFCVKKIKTPRAIILVFLVSLLLVIFTYWVLVDIRFKYYFSRTYWFWSKVITLQLVEELFIQNPDMTVTQVYLAYITMFILWLYFFGCISFILYIIRKKLPFNYQIKIYLTILYFLIYILSKVIWWYYFILWLRFLYYVQWPRVYNHPHLYTPNYWRFVLLWISLVCIYYWKLTTLIQNLKNLKNYWVVWKKQHPKFWVHCFIITILITLILCFFFILIA